MTIAPLPRVRDEADLRTRHDRVRQERMPTDFELARRERRSSSRGHWGRFHRAFLGRADHRNLRHPGRQTPGAKGHAQLRV
jgi:hypothetical protein